MKLSVVIVNYNVTALLEKCIISINKFIQVPHEIIVIDNASTDTSWKDLIIKFPQVHFIENEKNVGFSKANNTAVKKTKGEYLFILNPDTEILGNYFSEIIEFADSKDEFGSLGLRMEDAKGNFLPESKRSVPNMFNSFEKIFSGSKKHTSKSYYRNDVDEFEIAEVEILTGANLLIKKSVYEKIGGFDEKYFMYGEDIDLCYTLIQNHLKNYYFGKYTILHHKGESTIKNKDYIKRFYGAMEIFAEKYYKSKNPLQYVLIKSGLRIKKWMEYRKLNP